MQIIKKSSSGFQSLSLEAMLLSHRTIFLKGTITTESVLSIIQQLLFLETEDEHTPIKLILNSPGGSVSAGLSLYNQMKGMKVPINIYGFEFCGSMAAILLAGGQPGHRFLLKDSRVMIHEPLVPDSSGGISGSATSIQQAAESIMKIRDKLNHMLARDTGRSVKEIEKNTAYDHIMEAEEALRFGMVDAIVDRV